MFLKVNCCNFAYADVLHIFLLQFWLIIVVLRCPYCGKHSKNTMETECEHAREFSVDADTSLVLLTTIIVLPGFYEKLVMFSYKIMWHVAGKS